MNAVVFVLMIVNHGQPVPTLEFSTVNKCNEAIKTINLAARNESWNVAQMRDSFCVRIEK